MPEEKKKQICKVCPKKKKKVKEPKVQDEALEYPVEAEAEEEVGEEEEEKERNENEEEESLLCDEEAGSCMELVTTGYVLEEVFPPGKVVTSSYFGKTGPKTRYENMLPLDIVNSHQENAYLQKTIIDHLGALRVTSDPFCKRKTAIIATIGPSCWEIKEIKELLDAGMNIARINMAYGDRCCQYNAIYNFKEAVKNFHGKIGMNIPVGLMMDLKGPEIRTGRICRVYACKPEDPEILIEKGSVVRLTTEVVYIEKCTPNLIYIDYPNFSKYIRTGMKIYIDDGKIGLFVQKVKENEIVTSVEIGGYLKNYRPVHVPMVPFPVPAITNVDLEDIELAIEENFDYIVVSKLYSSEIIENLRKKLYESYLTLKTLKEKPIMILAKVSNFQAVSNIDSIINAADGIIIQRGDLGLDIPIEKVFVAQREIIAKCNLANKPVICSTHLLKSMIRRSTVDRSHVFDIANCIEDGADAVCLTGETAIGSFPSNAVEQIHHILREAEAADSRKYHFKEIIEKLEPPVEPHVAIGMAACLVAEKTLATSIIVLTTSGKSARVISWFRPRCPVLAVTPFERTARHLHLWRSVFPLYYSGPCIKNNWFDNLELRFQFAVTFGLESGLIKPGDPIVLVSVYGKNTGFTNFLRVIYASTEPGLYLEHPKEYYDNINIPKNCTKNEANESCNSLR